MTVILQLSGEFMETYRCFQIDFKAESKRAEGISDLILFYAKIAQIVWVLQNCKNTLQFVAHLQSIPYIN
ncbi:MAG: hypothetical protein IFNCLDLE_00962 [Ignavibacteriaceae bacterium]|nr:hypothetical protein [Ignavibacteriaceae bacterium]OQY79168.1 MAG: hypothetical protein B6D45_01490 [Ignavibacteriales bacterium UTCHB3]